MTPCTAEPVSWLALERLALGELDGVTASRVRAHLDGCAACRQCLARIEADGIALPALPVMAPRRAWGWPRLVGLGGGLVAAAAGVVLWLVVRPPDVETAGTTEPVDRRLAVKGGGELIVSVVRERGGEVALDATSFAEGDRLKVRVTCDRALATAVDVVVYQREGGRVEASFPLPPARLACGNQVVVPGAFGITGGDAQVCMVVGAVDDAALDRDRLARGPDPATMACRTLSRE